MLNMESRIKGGRLRWPQKATNICILLAPEVWGFFVVVKKEKKRKQTNHLRTICVPVNTVAELCIQRVIDR